MSDQKDRPLHRLAARQAVGEELQPGIPCNEMRQDRNADAAPHGLGLAGQRVYRQPWRMLPFESLAPF